MYIPVCFAVLGPILLCVCLCVWHGSREKLGNRICLYVSEEYIYLSSVEANLAIPGKSETGFVWCYFQMSQWCRETCGITQENITQYFTLRILRTVKGFLQIQCHKHSSKPDSIVIITVWDKERAHWHKWSGTFVLPYVEYNRSDWWKWYFPYNVTFSPALHKKQMLTPWTFLI